MKLPWLFIWLRGLSSAWRTEKIPCKGESVPRLTPCDCWRMVNSVLNEGKSAIPPLCDEHESLSPASDKAKLFSENFSKIANLGDWGISLPAFPSRTNPKLYNILETSKLVKKVITKIDWSKSGGSRVVSDRIARDFDRCRASLVIVTDISKAFDMVLHAGLLHKIKSYGISGQVFSLVLSFLSIRGLLVVLDQLILELLKGQFLALQISFLMMFSVIFISMLMMSSWLQVWLGI